MTKQEKEEKLKQEAEEIARINEKNAKMWKFRLKWVKIYLIYFFIFIVVEPVLIALIITHPHTNNFLIPLVSILFIYWFVLYIVFGMKVNWIMEVNVGWFIVTAFIFIGGFIIGLCYAFTILKYWRKDQRGEFIP
ncbi:hypothetical protein [Metamycoplasma hyosynoviae]|uniref:hypothetical protein n=1 Tax=Metamycoplasma hyosynoviae TaxID=29559 RepID=UPI00046145BC|nr:hypothetical protein [Metamycoplasma hyosynoviae]KDE45326.1 hypothetical protein NPL4_01670 [Metamycoplasma hyosynoviae]MDC8921374.1 hypothetical protein [Metamycoplasma hyosynoviae]MDD1373738.1 hypothetical protein [Metamycoplasma hyosynoviae]MDD1375942.1 hypothetical protein [Metamycoplasma hyosynoviae]MDD1376654.1 hypothetical protein [Metamycoplasma hyosynoviae]